jgi:hypothetical protein
MAVAMRAEHIATSLRVEAARLRERVEQLESAAAILEGAVAPQQEEARPAAPVRRRRHPVAAEAPYGLKADGTPRKRPGRPRRVEQEAPFGYKADGTPRKRPAPSADAQARSAATRRAKSNGKSGGVELRVLSSTHPTPEELKDRELVHTTESAAG